MDWLWTDDELQEMRADEMAGEYPEGQCPKCGFPQDPDYIFEFERECTRCGHVTKTFDGED